MQLDKVKIVSSLPRGGRARADTEPVVNAIRLALADFERAVPFAVQLLDWDDANPRTGNWTPDAEQDNAERAVADKDVMAFIGPYNSGAARVSAPVLNRAGLVQVSPAATLPGLTHRGPNSDPDEPEKYRPGKKLTFCRVCPHDGSQGPLSADFAATELGAKSVYVLDDKELYGLGVATAFKKRCAELKVKVAAHESVATAAPDFKKVLAKVRDAAPDLVYYGGTTQTRAPELARAMIAEKVACPLMLPEGCYEPAFVDAVSADAFEVLKVFVTVTGINPAHLKGAGADFVKRYTDKHKNAPTAYAVYGYEAAAVVLEALRAAGKRDREAVRKAVLATTDFDKGLLGKWGFDANGDTTHQPLTVATVEKGRFKAVKVLGVR